MLRCLMIWFLLIGFFAVAQDVPRETEEAPVTIPAPTAGLEQGKAFFAQGDMFGAESQFLGIEPSSENRVVLAQYLSAVAQRTQAVAAKRVFYESNLARDPEWRAMALLVLCHLTAAEENWNEFQRFAQLYLTENEPLPGDGHWFMIYALARFSAAEPPDLSLNPDELRWFLVSRQTPPDRAFPLSAPDALPYFWRHGALLELNRPFTLPDLGPNPSDRDLLLYQMLEIKNALNRDDTNLAATKINQMNRKAFGDVDTHLKIHFSDLLAAFYEKRDKPESRKKALRNRAVYVRWALFPVIPRPEAVAAGEAKRIAREQRQAATEAEAVAEQNATTAEAAPPEDSVKEPEPETKPTATTSEPERPIGFAHLVPFEARLSEGRKADLDTLLSFKATTTAQEIYRDYLVGSWHLEQRRSEEASVFLSKAIDRVLELPFPALESKIRMALARNYDLLGNTDRRDWHYLRAVEIWKTPENVPLLALSSVAHPVNPLKTMIDRALVKHLDAAGVAGLFTHGELEHLLSLRGLALKRKALSRNQVLDHQLHQVGGQLAAMVDELMTSSGSAASPRRYNQTLEIWTQLWDQVQPTYRETSFNSLAQVQQALNQRDRILYFVEGREQLGLLVLSKTQAFGVSLGSPAAFRAMDNGQQLAFMEGRLGPVWNHHGPVMVRLSATLLDTDFAEALHGHCQNPERLSFLFSLRDVTRAYVQNECANFAIAVKTESDVLEAWSGTVPARERQIWTEDEWVGDRGYERFEWADRLLYQGALEHHEEGLILGSYSNGLPLLRLLHLNLDLCSMAIVSKSLDSWSSVFRELELLDPSGRIAFDLYHKLPSRLPEDPRGRGGVRFYLRTD